MAKNDEKEWDPSQPLEDAEDEATAQAKARAASRVEYLRQQALSKVKKEKKKGIFDI